MRKIVRHVRAWLFFSPSIFRYAPRLSCPIACVLTGLLYVPVVPLSRPDSPALFARPVASVPCEVFTRERVSVLAVGLPEVFPARPITAKRVYSGRYGLKMFRVYARPVSTEVVDCEALRDWAMLDLVHDPMHGTETPFACGGISKFRVSVHILGSDPLPASCWRDRHLNLRHDSGEVGGDVFHTHHDKVCGVTNAV